MYGILSKSEETVENTRKLYLRPSANFGSHNTDFHQTDAYPILKNFYTECHNNPTKVFRLLRTKFRNYKFWRHGFIFLSEVINNISEAKEFYIFHSVH
jgi:hypothetical protein